MIRWRERVRERVRGQRRQRRGSAGVGRHGTDVLLMYMLLHLMLIVLVRA
jgi:hypothetical protein